MKAFKTFTIVAIFVNIIILSIYKHQFGLKTIAGMMLMSAVAALLIYAESLKIKRSWDENERKVLIKKVTELSVLTLMTCFSGALFVKIIIHTFI